MHDSGMTPSETLVRGIALLGLELGPAAQASLLSYVELLLKWNRVYNLTSVRNPVQMVTRHLLDSLAVVPHIKGPRLLDVGSGAGLPGIPLAIAHPEWSITLLDSNNKKTRFLTQAVAQLKLAQVEVVHTRIEEYRPTERFDTVIARAYASVEQLCEAAGPLLKPDGRVLAMKGVYPLAELEARPPGFTLHSVPRLEVPFLNAERHLVRLEPTG